jgi:hypothetical protein
MSYAEDYRDLATILKLRGGTGILGNSVAVTVEDEEAIGLYGKQMKALAETQWTSKTICTIRANQLLDSYSEPAVNVVLDCEPEIVAVGDQIHFVSSSMAVDDYFTVRSIQYEYDEGGERMTLELTNHVLSLADVVAGIEDNLRVLGSAVVQRTASGQILRDNFDDNDLDPAWTYEEGDAASTGLEQNQQLEFSFKADSYAHMQRLLAVDDPVLIVKANQISTAVASWGACLVLWFNQYDWAQMLLDSINNRVYFNHDKNSTFTVGSYASYTPNTWLYLKIKIATDTVYFYYSADARTWTLLGSTARPATWIIDASSLLILGHGFEEKAAAYPNPDFDNNYSVLGAVQTSKFDDLIAMTNETITVNGLPYGWYFEVYDGDTLIGTSDKASAGTATLDISGFEDLVPFDKIQIFDLSGDLMLEYEGEEDVWGGDIYNCVDV